MFRPIAKTIGPRGPHRFSGGGRESSVAQGPIVSARQRTFSRMRNTLVCSTGKRNLKSGVPSSTFLGIAVGVVVLVSVIVSPGVVAADPVPDVVSVPPAAVAEPPQTEIGGIEIIDGVPPGFEVVRLTNEPVSSSVPEINNRSEVVWGTRVGFDPVAVYKIHRFSNGVVQTLTDGTNVDWQPTNNDESEIAWVHCPYLFTGPCTVAASFALDPIDEGLTPIGNLSMDTQGNVVWAYELPIDPDRQEIVFFDRSNGTAQILTDAGLMNATPRMNAAQEIVWNQFNFQVSPWVGTIMFWSEGQLQSVSSGQTQAQSPDLNDQGLVVWRDPPDIMLWDGSSTTNLTAAVSGNKITPRINNAGDVYFGLSVNGKWAAILTKDGDWYRLPDLGLESAQGSLNDRGELAWRVRVDPPPNSNILLLRRIAPKGDFNHDCRIDMVDLRVMQICYTGADNGPQDGFLAQCTRADFDEDGDVDVQDFSAFLEAKAGPTVLVPDCEP